MTYLLYQIWLCLLITAFIAGLLGWLLRDGGKDKLRALNTHWQDKYDTLSQERNSYANKINKLTGITHEKERLEHKLSTQEQTQKQKTNVLNKQLADAKSDIKQYQTLLSQKDEEIAMNMVQLDKKIIEVEDDKKNHQEATEKELIAFKEDLENAQKNNQKLQQKIKEKTQVQASTQQTKQHLKEAQEETNRLKKTLTLSQTESTQATKKLSILKTTLEQKQQDINILINDFSNKKTQLGQQLNEKQTLINRLIADNEKMGIALQQAKTIQKNEAKNNATKEHSAPSKTTINNQSQPTQNITNTSPAIPTPPLTPSTTHQQITQSSPPYQYENINNDNNSGIKNIFASTDFAELAKSSIRKAKNSLNQAKESLTHYPDAKEAIFPIDAIQSVSTEDDKRLYTMDIITTQDLLKKASTQTGIQLLAKSLGKETWVVQDWVNSADLIRIKGVDGITAELLTLSGADSVKKVANTTVDELSAGIATVHGYIQKRSTLPSRKAIQQLIDEAKKLV